MSQVSNTSKTNPNISTTQTTSTPSHTAAIRNEDSPSVGDNRVNTTSSRPARLEPSVETPMVAASQDVPSSTRETQQVVTPHTESRMCPPTSFPENTTIITRTQPAHGRATEYVPSIRSPRQPEQNPTQHLGMALGNRQLLRPRSSLDRTRGQQIVQPVPQQILYDNHASTQPGFGPTLSGPLQHPIQDPRYIAAWQPQQQQVIQSPRQIKAENMGYYFNPQQVMPQMPQDRTIQAPVG